MNDAETRCRSEVRVRKNADGTRVIHGYAAVFNSWSEDLGGFVERIIPGAFSRVISERQDVRALVGHDTTLVLGRTKSGTLRLTEDERGLAFELDAPSGPMATHYIDAVERGDMDGMSFRFVPRQPGGDRWDFDVDPPRRDLLNVDIDEISLVTYPAYADTTAAVRSLEANRRTQPLRTPRRDRLARLIRLAMAE